MIKYGTWRLKTCRCEFVTKTDHDLLPSDPGHWTYARTIKTCIEHKPLEGQALWDAAYGDSKTQTYIFALAQTLKPDLKRIDYHWDWDPPQGEQRKRMLHALFRGMTEQAKIELRNNLTYQREPGEVYWDMTDKVVIE